MNNDIFYRKNDLGVEIEYEIVGHHTDGVNKYIIYTDFVPVDYGLGIRLFVDKIEGNNYIRIDSNLENVIIDEFNNETFSYLKEIENNG